MKDFAVALSLANLSFLAVWGQFDTLDYFLQRPPNHSVLAALVLDVLLLTVVLFGVMRLIRRSKNARLIQRVQLATLVLFVIPFDWIRRQTTSLSLGHVLALGPVILSVIALVAVGMGYFAVTRFLRPVTSVASTAALIMLPAVLVTFPRVIKPWLAAGQSVSESNRQHRVDQDARQPAHQVFWFIFDELDQRASSTWSDRPAMPELDRLRSGSLIATEAHPPNGSTLLSMPSLLTGRIVRKAVPEPPSELLLTYEDGPADVPLSREPTVFTRARADGYATTMLGWYHPYCRILGSSLTNCWWESQRRENEPAITVGEMMARHVQNVITYAPLMERFNIDLALRTTTEVHLDAERHLRRYEHIREQALLAVTDLHGGLVVVHWPVPHLPAVYSAVRQDMSVDGSGSYRDNLVLVDRTVGEIRSAMEQAGTWQHAAVIISADHFWRRSPIIDQRVPFIVHMPGSADGIDYRTPVNTVLTASLAIDILEGRVNTARDVASWLERH